MNNCEHDTPKGMSCRICAEKEERDAELKSLVKHTKEICPDCGCTLEMICGNQTCHHCGYTHCASCG